jgi:uncharacterized membrane protein YdfJ with MMPL/SSD domain
VTIEWFRDLVISIWGLVATGVLIFVAVLSYLLYRRLKSILESVKITSRTIQDISSYAGDKVAKPLIELAAVIQGIRQGINMVSKFIKKKEGGRDV